MFDQNLENITVDRKYPGRTVDATTDLLSSVFQSF
jgi:hypothetical protein